MRKNENIYRKLAKMKHDFSCTLIVKLIIYDYRLALAKAEC